MPAKTPIYLKPANSKKGKKCRLRDILSPDMISPPLGDFRHTIHIGRGGERDAFGDMSFLQGKFELLPGKGEPARPQYGLHSEFLRANSASEASFAETPSPVLKNAISLPSIGGCQALTLPLLSAAVFSLPAERLEGTAGTTTPMSAADRSEELEMLQMDALLHSIEAFGGGGGGDAPKPASNQSKPDVLLDLLDTPDTPSANRASESDKTHDGENGFEKPPPPSYYVNGGGNGNAGGLRGYSGGNGIYSGFNGNVSIRNFCNGNGGFDGKDRSFNGKNSVFDGKDRSFNGKDSVFDGKDRSFDGKDRSFNGKDRSFNGKDSVFDGKDSVFDGKDRSFNGKDSVFDGKDRSFNGKDSVFDGKDRSFNGKDSPRITCNGNGGFAVNGHSNGVSNGKRGFNGNGFNSSFNSDIAPCCDKDASDCNGDWADRDSGVEEGRICDFDFDFPKEEEEEEEGSASQESLCRITGSLLSLELDLGPSILDDVLDIMDKPKARSRP